MEEFIDEGLRLLERIFETMNETSHNQNHDSNDEHELKYNKRVKV